MCDYGNKYQVMDHNSIIIDTMSFKIDGYLSTYSNIMTLEYMIHVFMMILSYGIHVYQSPKSCLTDLAYALRVRGTDRRINPRGFEVRAPKSHIRLIFNIYAFPSKYEKSSQSALSVACPPDTPSWQVVPTLLIEKCIRRFQTVAWTKVLVLVRTFASAGL